MRMSRSSKAFSPTLLLPPILHIPAKCANRQELSRRSARCGPSVVEFQPFQVGPGLPRLGTYFASRTSARNVRDLEHSPITRNLSVRTVKLQACHPKTAQAASRSRSFNPRSTPHPTARQGSMQQSYDIRERSGPLATRIVEHFTLTITTLNRSLDQKRRGPLKLLNFALRTTLS